MTVKELITKFPDDFLVDIYTPAMRSSGYAKTFKVIKKPDPMLDATNYTWQVLYNTETKSYWLVIGDIA